MAVEKGRAKTMASLWQNRQDERKPRQPFRLELDVQESNAAGVYENEPTALDGVVRSTDQVILSRLCSWQFISYPILREPYLAIF